MKYYQWVKDEIEKLLTAKVIQGSRSSWSTPIIVIPKGDRGKCLVIDYQALNKVTRKFIWPMPKVEDIFSQLNGTKYFSILDLTAGYHHIPLDEESIPKTAFTSPFGKYQYIKVLFRLAQSPAYFQEVMTGILKVLNFAIAHLDDIIIFSKTAEEYLDHIRQVFTKLRSAHLSMELSKCHFFTKEIQYLGHILSTMGIRPLPSNSEHASTQHVKTSMQISWTCRILQQIHKEFCKNSKISDIINISTSPVGMDTNTLQILLNTQGISQPSTNCTLPKSEEMLHSLHRCIWRCLWGTTFPGTCWHKISHSLPLAHIHENSSKMEYHRTRGLWCILQSLNGITTFKRAKIIVRNEHKPLARFLNGKNACNKVNRWMTRVSQIST